MQSITFKTSSQQIGFLVSLELSDFLSLCNIKDIMVYCMTVN